MNNLYIITHKGKRVAVHHAETKWEAINTAYNDAICRGFDVSRNHFDAFRKPKPKARRKAKQLKMF